MNQNSDMENQELESKAKSLGVPFVEKIPNIDKDTILSIPEETAKRYQIAVFEKNSDHMKVAMTNPQDIEALNVLRFISEKEGKEIQIYMTSNNILEELLDMYSSAEKAVEAVVDSFKGNELKEKEESDTGSNLKEVIQDAPVSKLVQVVIEHAIEGNASDIHIEPIDNEYRIRFRVDGILHSSLNVPVSVGKAITSRVKILSNLKIDEKRKPQDGRFKISLDGKSIDFRVSTFPVVEGEKVVLRVLDNKTGVLSLDDLGLMGRNKEVMNQEIKNPNGIILITGPTGSGKSTTLYAFLGIINKEERNIVTLEDPVEYSIEGINQSQIKPEIGYDFASGLRSILRQDPNVIMVGEIRDSETAELAIHSALTGHLVFSTLHTNSAIGAIPRLIDMGIEPFLIASSVNIVAAQRLVRRICQNCKEEFKAPDNIVKMIEKEISGISKEEIGKYGLDISKGMKFYKGKGCDKCGGTGMKGRIAIYECIEIDEDIKNDIADKSEMKLDNIVKRQGVLTIKQDGLLKVLKGMTTIAEVERVTEGSQTIGGDVDDDKG